MLEKTPVSIQINSLQLQFGQTFSQIVVIKVYIYIIVYQCVFSTDKNTPFLIQFLFYKPFAVIFHNEQRGHQVYN